MSVPPLRGATVVEGCGANRERVASLHLQVGDLILGTSLVREVSKPQMPDSEGGWGH